MNMLVAPAAESTTIDLARLIVANPLASGGSRTPRPNPRRVSFGTLLTVSASLTEVLALAACISHREMLSLRARSAGYNLKPLFDNEEYRIQVCGIYNRALALFGGPFDVPGCVSLDCGGRFLLTVTTHPEKSFNAFAAAGRDAIGLSASFIEKMFLARAGARGERWVHWITNTTFHEMAHVHQDWSWREAHRFPHKEGHDYDDSYYTNPTEVHAFALADASSAFLIGEQELSAASAHEIPFLYRILCAHPDFQASHPEAAHIRSLYRKFHNWFRVAMERSASMQRLRQLTRDRAFMTDIEGDLVGLRKIRR